MCPEAHVWGGGSLFIVYVDHEIDHVSSAVRQIPISNGCSATTELP